MKAIFINPDITVREPSKANIFFNKCTEEVQKYLFDTFIIRNINQIPRVLGEINNETLLIIFNNNSEEYPQEIINLIKTAKKENAEIWPVAIDKEFRMPMKEIGTNQSYDVFEQLRCRNLDEEYLITIGVVFARKIISRILPNLYSNNNSLFISHRRLDGEILAGNFYDQLIIQSKDEVGFRDVVNVEVGEEAQNVIDSELSKSDILVFIHTERSAESDWIKKELIYAVLNDIPIIWIRIDNANIENLYIKPCDKPHIECKSEDFNNKHMLTKIVDDVLQKSFEIIMIKSNGIYDKINAFKEFCKFNKLNLIEENKNKLIFALECPRRGYSYPQRNINHYIQCFGRNCKEEDLNEMIKFLESKKHNKNKLYDSAILLSDKVRVREVKDSIVKENYDDFYNNLKDYFNYEKKPISYEIIISGSFPECDQIYKQCLYNAVNIFSKEILKNGFTLTFGAHPTFQNIIFEISKKFRTKDYKKSIKMFISKFFKDKYDINMLNMNATVIETEDIEHDLLKSLSKMREKMISGVNVKALICLGGIIREGDNTQGIDEEIKIARSKNIPVFVIGTVGGRSAQIAIEHMKEGKWTSLNNESKAFNEQLTLDLDYKKLANDLINIIKND